MKEETRGFLRIGLLCILAFVLFIGIKFALKSDQTWTTILALLMLVTEIALLALAVREGALLRRRRADKSNRGGE
jgi:uncharacterized membrane protein YhaH (DUF805 family)